MERNHEGKAITKRKRSFGSTKFIFFVFLLLFVLILFRTENSPFTSSTSASITSRAFFNGWRGKVLDADEGPPPPPWDVTNTLISKLRDSVTFLPLKDLRFAETAMTGNTWFMSSLNDTHEKNEAEYLYFPSQASKGRLLCIKGRNTRDGTKNSYALAWPESLPDSAVFMKGLTFASDTYYDHENLWHGLSAVAPFVGWSIKNGCLRPTRWVLFHQGELRSEMGPWLQNLTQASFGEVRVEKFKAGNGPYCFEKAVVVRHDWGTMGKEKKLQVSDLMRCRARLVCGINPAGKGREVNEEGKPIIRLTLLMRRGSRSFKNATTVVDIFARECAKVEGCLLNVVQSDDLSFCDQVRVMTYTDIVATPHGAQMTNLLFMERNSSVMEFFPRGWLELAGPGQYVFQWLAEQSGIKHQGAWRDPLGEKQCPSPENDLQCFNFYKNGKVGHNETFFADWTRTVLNKVRTSKLEQATKGSPVNSTACIC